MELGLLDNFVGVERLEELQHNFVLVVLVVGEGQQQHNFVCPSGINALIIIIAIYL